MNYKVVQCEEWSRRSVEEAVRRRRELEIRIAVVRTMASDEVGREMVFRLVPCRYLVGGEGACGEWLADGDRERGGALEG